MRSNLLAQFLCLCSLIIASNGSPLVLTILIEDNVNTTTASNTSTTPTNTSISTPVPVVIEIVEVYVPGKVVECGGTQNVREGETYVFRNKNSDRFRRSPYWYPPHHPPRFQQHGYRYPLHQRPYPFYPHPPFGPAIPGPRPITNIFTKSAKPNICLITFKTSSNCDLVANFDHHEIGDSSCSNQYLLLGDENREIQICGYTQFPGFYKSHGNELFIKHYKKAAAWGSEFQGIVTCIKRFPLETTPGIRPRDEESDEEDIGEEVEVGYAGQSESFFPDVEIEIDSFTTSSAEAPSPIASSSTTTAASSSTTSAPSSTTFAPSSTTFAPSSTTSAPSSTTTQSSTTASSTSTSSTPSSNNSTTSSNSTTSTQSPQTSTVSPADQLQRQTDDSVDDLTDVGTDLSDTVFNLDSPIAPSDLLNRQIVDIEDDTTDDATDLSETVFNMDVPDNSNQGSTSTSTLSPTNEDTAFPSTGVVDQEGGHRQYADTDAAAFAEDDPGSS